MALGEMLFSEDSPLYPVGHLLGGVGAVNWLSIAVADLNLVTAAFGEGTTATMAVYVLAGLGGLQILGDLAMDYGMME